MWHLGTKQAQHRTWLMDSNVLHLNKATAKWLTQLTLKNHTSLYDRGPASRKDGLQLIVICNKKIKPVTTSKEMTSSDV